MLISIVHLTVVDVIVYHIYPGTRTQKYPYHTTARQESHNQSLRLYPLREEMFKHRAARTGRIKKEEAKADARVQQRLAARGNSFTGSSEQKI